MGYHELIKVSVVVFCLRLCFLFRPDFDLLRVILVVFSVALTFAFFLFDSRRLEDLRLFFRLLFVRSAAVDAVGTAVNSRRNPLPSPLPSDTNVSHRRRSVQRVPQKVSNF